MNWKDLLICPVGAPSHTDEEISIAIRGWRNLQLAASDWTQLPDVDASKVDVPAWRAYRQELRDMMSQNADPKEIIFPTQPS